MSLHAWLFYPTIEIAVGKKDKNKNLEDPKEDLQLPTAQVDDQKKPQIANAVQISTTPTIGTLLPKSHDKSINIHYIEINNKNSKEELEEE